MKAVLLLVGLLMPLTAIAQRGTGEPRGIASHSSQAATFDVTGTIASTKVGPCEHTTGRSLIGVHVFLVEQTGDTLNVHLGPQADLRLLAAHLQPGKPLGATVFTTERLPSGAVIAVSVDVDGETYVLRDATLKPTWSGPPGAARRPARGRRWN